MFFRFLRRPIAKASFASKKDEVWYMKSVVGTDKVSQTYRDLGDILEDESMKLVTGHGGRACLVTYSLLNGVTASAIRQQTGHANLQSMLPYDRISLDAEKVLQDCLAGKGRHREGETGMEERKSRAVKNTLLMKGRSPPASPTKLEKRTNKKKRGGVLAKGSFGVTTSTARELVVIDDSDEEGIKMRPIKVHRMEPITML